jgi:hypothetical protein
MKHLKLAVAALALTAAFVAVPAFADPPSPANPAGVMLGVVPVHNQAKPGGGGGSNLVYHNGPVMRTNTTYAIYWVPSGFSVSAGYQSLINGFLGNVAADSGKTSNVYWSDAQYRDTTGSIAYSSTFGGAWTDTAAFPASGCSDSYTAVCLSDAQLQAEVKHAIAVNGWPNGGPTNLFFVFTPRNVGSCSGSSCAFSYFCAYHSWIGSGSSAIMYANQPYAAFVPNACGTPQSPNGDDADSTINVASHEHNEAITDPQGSAWYDRRGQENGDKCAWNFGAATGSTSFGQFNQTIGGGHYYLQQEWSNATSRCVLTGQ